jgi:hypothetical protein
MRRLESGHLDKTAPRNHCTFAPFDKLPLVPRDMLAGERIMWHSPGAPDKPDFGLPGWRCPSAVIELLLPPRPIGSMQISVISGISGKGFLPCISAARTPYGPPFRAASAKKRDTRRSAGCRGCYTPHRVLSVNSGSIRAWTSARRRISYLYF